MTRTQNDSAAGYGAERNGLSPADLGELERLEAFAAFWEQSDYLDTPIDPPVGMEATENGLSIAVAALISRLRAAEGALTKVEAISDEALTNWPDHDHTARVYFKRALSDVREAARSALPHPVGEGT